MLTGKKISWHNFYKYLSIMKFKHHVFFLNLIFLSSALMAEMNQNQIIDVSYGSGETGAFFFVGREHTGADDLMRVKLGVPSHSGRVRETVGITVDGHQGQDAEKRESGYSFATVSKRTTESLSIDSTKPRRIKLKDLEEL